MDSDGTNRPYAIISSDCHAGADLRDYKPYLERRWHEEFDTWASSYTYAWAGIDTESEYKAGVSSFLSPLNWDSSKRLEVLESQGIVAEVIFPNTTPPFFPNGLLAAPGPRNRSEYDRRWACIRAHNRWLKDFCDKTPVVVSEQRSCSSMMSTTSSPRFAGHGRTDSARCSCLHAPAGVHTPPT